MTEEALFLEEAAVGPLLKTDPAFVEAFGTALTGLGLLGVPAFPTVECKNATASHPLSSSLPL